MSKIIKSTFIQPLSAGISDQPETAPASTPAVPDTPGRSAVSASLRQKKPSAAMQDKLLGQMRGGRKGADTAADKKPTSARQNRSSMQISDAGNFQQAVRTSKADVLYSKLATDANLVARQAMHDTDASIAEYLAPPNPADPEAQARKAALPKEVLECVAFELDCLGALSRALRGLQRSEQTKLSAARTVVAKADAQQASLTPLLAQQEQHAASFSQARSAELEMVDRRARQITDWLAQSGILNLQ